MLILCLEWWKKSWIGQEWISLCPGESDMPVWQRQPPGMEDPLAPLSSAQPFHLNLSFQFALTVQFLPFADTDLKGREILAAERKEIQ